MNYYTDGEEITVKGHKFKVVIEYDNCMAPPWENCDFHGVVVERAITSEKSPHELSMGDGYFYDLKATAEIAKRDGWGPSEKAVKSFVKDRGREPTNKEKRMLAIEDDFKRLKGWVNDEWHYVIVGVVHETGWSEYVGGVESDDYALIDKYVQEFAESCVEILDETCKRIEGDITKQEMLMEHVSAALAEDDIAAEVNKTLRAYVEGLTVKLAQYKA